MSAGPTGTRSHRSMSAMDRAGLWVIGTGAALVAALHVVGFIVSARQVTAGGRLEVADMPLGNARTPEFTEPFAAITEARYDSVTVTVDGAPAAARWLLWGADAASSLAALGISLTVVWLCIRVARQRPFSRSVTAALLVTASLVMASGMARQVLGAMGRAEIVDYLRDTSTGGDHGEGIVEGFAGFHLNLDLTPLAVGLALGVVVAAFEVGARMQRDTEGLV